MTHIGEERMWASVVERTLWSQEEAAHLQDCAECRGQVAQVAQIARDLEIARRSEPTEESLRRYSALFPQVQQKRTAIVRELLDALAALLVYDSRLQAAGVRAGSADTYSLIYETDDMDIELYVAPDREDHLRIEGAMTSTEEDVSFDPALVQLLPNVPGPLPVEVESANGRFRFERVPAGSYRLTVTPVVGRTIEVMNLDLV